MNLTAKRTCSIPGLPSPLEGCSCAADWTCRRRVEILHLLETLLFGKIPPRPERVRFELKRRKENVFGGRGSRREITIHLQNGRRKHSIDVLWYLPNRPGTRVPAVAGHG